MPTLVTKRRTTVTLSIKLAVPLPLANSCITLLSNPILIDGAFLKAVRSTLIWRQLFGVAGLAGSNGGRYVEPTCAPLMVTRKLVLAFAVLNNCLISKVSQSESVGRPPDGFTHMWIAEKCSGLLSHGSVAPPGTVQLRLVTPSMIRPLVEVVTSGEEALTCSSIFDLLLMSFRKKAISAGVSKPKVTGKAATSGFIMSSVSASLIVVTSPVSWVLAIIRWLPFAARLAVAINVYVAEAFGAIGLAL